MSSSMPPGRGAGLHPKTLSALPLSIWMFRIRAGTIQTGSTFLPAASSIVQPDTGALCPRLAAIACYAPIQFPITNDLNVLDHHE